MIGKTRDWIVGQLMFGRFSTRSDVVIRAVVLAAKIALLALAVNLGIEALMGYLGLLPYPFSQSVPMIFIMSPLIAFPVGFVAYLVIGFAIYDLSRERSEFERLSMTDQLSGLANRRSFLDTFERCDREGTSLLVFDIDHFKRINDRFGHAAGDQVIVAVADVLASVFTSKARNARIGGEEFAVLLCGRSVAEAMALGEIARMRVEALRPVLGDEKRTVTMSGGLTALVPEDDFNSAFSRADTALYKAKADGRNRVAVSLKGEPASLPSGVEATGVDRRGLRGAAG